MSRTQARGHGLRMGPTIGDGSENQLKTRTTEPSNHCIYIKSRNMYCYIAYYRQHIVIFNPGLTIFQ